MGSWLPRLDTGIEKGREMPPQGEAGRPRPESTVPTKEPVHLSAFREGVPAPATTVLQVIVQRSLAARSLSHAKGGSLMAAYLKVLPLFMMVFPGMVSRVLFPGERRVGRRGPVSVSLRPCNMSGEHYWLCWENVAEVPS